MPEKAKLITNKVKTPDESESSAIDSRLWRARPRGGDLVGAVVVADGGDDKRPVVVGGRDSP